ncbi:right-handed parallel beta-helix repeat-containing protein, partial [Candidatus Micrarchaeota archaeon]|nr:right-handed parallel beta-helix repeat-containing protein [Candidatus Micrarchaeota archaeon]
MDPTKNTLTLTAFNPGSVYSILQRGISNCTTITASGNYEIVTNLAGAPVNASEMFSADWACIKIAASNVVLDCNGQNIMNNGTSSAAAIAVNGSATKIHSNILIRNCNVSGYDAGVLLQYTNASNVTNVTAERNTRGFYLQYSPSNNLSGNRGYNNSIRHFYVAYSDNTTIANNSIMLDGAGIDIDPSSNYAVISGNSISNISTGVQSYSDYNVITNNEIANFTTAGMRLDSGDNSYGFVVVNNSIHDGNNNAVYMTQQFDGILSNNTICDANYGIQMDVNVINFTVENNTICRQAQYGIYGSIVYRNRFISNRIFGNQNGTFLGIGRDNNFTGNNITDNYNYGFYSSSNNRSNVTNNRFGNNTYGVYIQFNSDNSTYLDNEIYGNQYGLYVNRANNTTIANTHLYNNSLRDFWVAAAVGEPSKTVFVSNMTIDNPAGNFANRSILYINDTVENGTAYYIRWTPEPASLPFARTAFAGKNVNITTVTGTVSIDAIQFAWLLSEVNLTNNETLFELWKYNASDNWTLQNSSPSVLLKRLSLYSLNPASTYSILEYSPSSCPVITAAGEYSMSANFTGAPNNASEIAANAYACVKIAASNVTFDCAGYSITGTGSPGSAQYGILLNGSLNNVTVRNCPAVSNYTNGIHIYQSNSSLFANISAFNNSNSGLYLDTSPNNTLSNNSAYQNLGSGILLNSTNASHLQGNTAYGNAQNGILLLLSSNNSLDGDLAHSNVFNGIRLFNRSSFNGLVNCTAWNNGLTGIAAVSNSNSNTFTNISSYGNNLTGITLGSAYGNAIFGAHLFNNARDFLANATTAAPMPFIMAYAVFDSPPGAYQNFTNLSINDSVEGSSAYTINWSVNESALPWPTFESKFVNITGFAAGISIDSLAWHWTDGEAANYSESSFELWKYNSSGWGSAPLNGTPDTSGNTLRLFNHSPASIYAILQGPPNCPIITSPGLYVQENNYTGAPNPFPPGGGYACVHINSSDVIFDCNGSTITGNGTSLTAGIAVTAYPAPLTNVTIRNCPSISGYEDGVLSDSIENSTFYNVTAHNNTLYGFYLSDGANNTVADSTAYNNSDAGFYIADASDTLANNSAYGNSDGFRLDDDGANVTGNLAYDNGRNGFIAGSADRIANNSAYGNAGAGFLVNRTFRNTLIGNNAHGNANGFYVTNSGGGKPSLGTNTTNIVSGNDAYDNSMGGFFLEIIPNNILDNNTAFNNTGSGFLASSCQNATVTGNRAYNNTRGFGMLDSGVSLPYAYGGSLVANNTAYGNAQYGFGINYPDISFTNNTAYGNPYGLWLNYTSDVPLSGNTLFNNTQAGLYSIGTPAQLSGDRFYNNGRDLIANETDGSPVALDMAGVIFDNPSGVLHQNFTNLTISDTLQNESYSINWSVNSSALPAYRTTFDKKYVDISVLSGNVSIGFINWTWLASELAGHNENKFELWKHNASSNWTLQNSTPDNSTHTLSLTAMNPASIYAIFERSNLPPIVQNVTLNSTFGTNYTTENLTVYWNASDADNDSIKNITNWYRNTTSIMALNMPFEGGSNATFTRSYIAPISNGVVSGASWNATGGYDGWGAYAFDGINDYISVPDSFSLDITQQITIETRIYPRSFTGPTGAPSIIQKGAQAAEAYGLAINSSGYIRMGINNQWDPGCPLPATDRWYHVAATFDGQQKKIYVDGVLCQTVPQPTTIIANAFPLTIGYGGANAQYFNGTIDEVRIYSRSLSAEEILALYNNRTDLMVSQELRANDVWHACIFPNDGATDGTQNCSNNLQVRTSNCPIITTSGTYTMLNNYTGSPNPAPEIVVAATACVKIAASDVVFDCAGYSITGNASGGFQKAGIIINSSYNNVTVKNCPGISNYTYGIYSKFAQNSTIANVTVRNNTADGIRFVGGSRMNVTGSAALDNGGAGFNASKAFSLRFENDTAARNQKSG